MTSATLLTQAKRFTRPVPAIKTGFTVRVHERIQEGAKERVQIFEGLVIATHHGHIPTDATFTVRKIVSGIGVEKVFSVHSPVIEKIEVKKVAKVRRTKLFFIRGRSGKAARLNERFTTEGEYAAPQEEVAEEVVKDEIPVATEQETLADAPATTETEEKVTTDKSDTEEKPAA